MSTEQTIDIPQEYKITELGVLPKDWSMVKLGIILKEKDTRVKDLNYKDIPVLSITRYEGLILQSKKFNKRVASVDIQKYKVVEKGQIVYGFPMDEGVIYSLKNIEMGAVSPVYEVWKVNSEIAFTHFVDYILKTPFMISTYKKLSSNTVHRRRIVKKDDFKKIIIPLPPLPEQQAIAYVLQTVQEAKERIEGVIQAAKELKKSLLKYLFTYGPVPVEDAENVSLKDTEVGMIPEEWQVVRLGEVAEKPTYGLTTTATSSLTPYKLLRISDIQDGRINWENVPFCERDEPSKEKYILKNNDIVIARIGATTGKAIQYKKGPITLFASYLIRIRTKQPLESNFLINFFYTDFYWKQINEQKGGRLKKGVNIPIINNLLIPLPSLHIQQRITDILSTVDERIESAENQKQSLDILFKTLLSRLMSGKIRVNRSHRLVDEVEYEKG